MSAGGQKKGERTGGRDKEGEEDEETDDDSNPNPEDILPLFEEESANLAENVAQLCVGDQKTSPTAEDGGREGALEKFREKWREELESRKDLQRQKLVSSTSSSRGTSPDVHKFEKAKSQFLQGIEQEKSGLMQEAVRSYNRAIHLVPEIESLIFNKGTGKKAPIRSSEASSGQDTPNEHDRIPDKELISVLGSRLYSAECGQISICQPEVENRGVHISQLPIEVLFKVFQWVIGPDLDVRSLEQISAVSAGFYILCRDQELWRLICIRTWGLRACRPQEMSSYLTWRRMFIERPHVWTNGVYISRSTYVRHGEASFQDQFYKPWHIVVYYRYLRFFPDGTVLMLTTPDEPTLVLPYVRSQTGRYPGLMKGIFEYSGPDHLTATLSLMKSPPSDNSLFGRKKKSHSGHEPVGHTFNLELEIAPLRKKRHYRLLWQNYEVVTKQRDGKENRTDFDLNESSFPPFYFSRVRSYAAFTEGPLV